MKKNVILISVLAILSILGIMACNKSEKSKGNAKLELRLTDAPGVYEAVNVDVQKIEIHSEQNGWVEYNLLNPGVYNLLDFSNGLDTLIADLLLPAGQISQMRLILGNNNSVVVNGVNHPLSTPSAQQSGLKFNIHQDLVPNGSYKVWIDFDAGKSIVQNGNGNYSLKPVIRAYTEATNGKIMGIVNPLNSGTIVYAIQGSDTVASAIPSPLGMFMISGLVEGNYTIFCDGNLSLGFNDITIPNVNVVFGQTTDLGTIILP